MKDAKPRSLKDMQRRQTRYEVILTNERDSITVGFTINRSKSGLLKTLRSRGQEIIDHTKMPQDSEVTYSGSGKNPTFEFDGKWKVRFSGKTERDVYVEKSGNMKSIYEESIGDGLMKITKTQLRQIIREELENLNEATQTYVVQVFGPRTTWLKSIKSDTLGQTTTVDDVVASAAKQYGLKQLDTKNRGTALYVEYSAPDKKSMLQFKNVISGISQLHFQATEFR